MCWNEVIFIFLTSVLFNVGANDLRLHRSWPRQFDDNCGENFADRIIGGKNASLGQYPWIARLHINCKIAMTSYLDV